MHRDYIDSAVDGEQIRAILGVPLTVEGKVIGALLAVHRTVRPFPRGEVALLTSFAAHAAVALENARLFEQASTAVAEADEANAELRDRTRPPSAPRSPTTSSPTCCCTAVGSWRSPRCWPRCSTAGSCVYDEEGRLLAGSEDDAATGLDDAVERGARLGAMRPDQLTAPGWRSPQRATSTSAPCVLRADAPLDRPERRTLERGALVTALVLLFGRVEAEAEEPGARRAARRPLGGQRPRHRPAARAGPPPGRRPRRPSWRRGRRSRGDRPAPSVARWRRLGRRAARPRRARTTGASSLLAPARSRSELGELLREPRWAAVDGRGGAGARAGPDGRSPRPGARRGSASTTLLRLGRAGRGQRPGRPRAWPGCSSAATGPEELDEFVDPTLGPVLDYDTDRGTELAATLEAWFAAGGGLRETADRLHVHPNTVTQRLDRVGPAARRRTGATRSGCSTCSWPCRWCRLRPLTCERRAMILGLECMSSHTWCCVIGDT